jgi:hypothetical protein
MVGYVQSLEEKELVTAVNAHLASEQLAQLREKNEREIGKGMHLTHTLPRQQIDARDIDLFHLWMPLKCI